MIFCLLYLQVRNHQNTSEKFQKFEKKLKSEVMTTFFQNISAKRTNFEVSSLGLELQISSLGLGVFDKVSVSVSSRNFNQVSVSVSKVMVSTTSLMLRSRCSRISQRSLTI